MRLPNDTQRIAIVGSTGSGKTQMAVYHLALRDWDKKPWIVYNYKCDDLIDSIKGARFIETSEVPKKPGIYVVHPTPDQADEVQGQLRKILERENIGIYVDEGYMICSAMIPNPPFRQILTQGRSKRIPVMILSQRPSWLDRFVWSESEFFQLFRLNNFDDRKQAVTVVPLTPEQREAQIPEYYSWYFDVARNKVELVSACPSADELLEMFETRMKSTDRVIFI